MNASEKKYALSRLDQIRNRHLQTIDDSLPGVPGLTAFDKIKLIRSKRARFIKPEIPTKANDKYGYDRGPYLIDCYEYPQEEEIKERNRQNEESKQQRRDALMAEHRRLCDLIVLGAGISIEEINAFEAREF